MYQVKEFLCDEFEIRRKYLGRGYDLQKFNCGSLITAVYRDLGMEVNIDACQMNKNSIGMLRHSFIEHYHKQWEKINEPELFDVVLFENSHGILYHGGIMLKDSKVLHCCRKVGVVVTRLKDITIRMKLNGFYRFKNNDKN